MPFGPCAAGLRISALRRQLREARDFGLDTLDSIIRTRTDYDYNFRQDYLSWHIHYHLGADERRGVGEVHRPLRPPELAPLAKAEGMAVIAYGENASDIGDHRPGARRPPSSRCAPRSRRRA